MLSAYNSNPILVNNWSRGQNHEEGYHNMGCTEYGVQPTVRQTLIQMIISCTHIHTSLLKAIEAKLYEYGQLEIVPLGHPM
jgi:sarcosine oxidase delta subunit